jgi:ABC-type Fe3+ transport system substrate-binding protein
VQVQATLVPQPKEGTYRSCGSGALSVVRGAPYSNAAKLFVNWLLSKEAQEIYSKAMGQAA